MDGSMNISVHMKETEIVKRLSVTKVISLIRTYSFSYNSRRYGKTEERQNSFHQCYLPKRYLQLYGFRKIMLTFNFEFCHMSFWCYFDP